MKNWMTKVAACDEAVAWVGEKSAEEAWASCEHVDWMLWALGRTKFPKTEIVALACQFARRVMHLNDDSRVEAAIVAAETWCAEPTEENANAARAAARAAAYAARAAAAYTAAYAAYAAAYTAAAAYAAAARAAAYAYAGRRTQIAMIRAKVSPAQFASLIAESMS